MAQVFPTILTFPRDEFVRERWHYEAGQHVTILGPTGSGKTHLAYELLAETATPKMQGVVLVMKPRDSTSTRWAKKSNFRRIYQWPPLRLPYMEKPPGYLLWPKATLNVDRDNAIMQVQFQRALNEAYASRQKWIVFADEIAGLTHDLDLDTTLNALWTRGRSMDAGLWAASQRPTHISRLAYTSPSHLFLAYTADTEARKRLGQIGGRIDPKLVIHGIEQLRKYQWLYIDEDGLICIVDK